MSEKHLFKHIMVLIDSTESASSAVDLAIRLARSHSARLTGLHIIESETLHQLLSARVLIETELREFKEALRESGNRHLDRAIQRAAKEKIKMEGVLVSGNCEKIIPRELEERQVDLLVMGAFKSSQTRFEMLLRQRQQILDHASCPVILASE